MKIKKVNELNEGFETNVNKNNEKIQKFKELLEDAFSAGEANIVNFSDFWNNNADRLIQEFGILDEEKSEPRANIREVLPQMVQLSNNSRITQQTAQRLCDKFTKAEIMDFKRWLQLIR